MEPCLPRYGHGALADLVPSLLASTGTPGTTDVLGVRPAPKVCLLLVDGLGLRLLDKHRHHAPFLASLAGGHEPITAGFPTTTATSITSLGTGLPSGEHGMVGYTFATGEEELFAPLGWRLQGTGEPAPHAAETIQPNRTAFQRAVEAGVDVRVVAPRDQRDTGLTTAAFRGATFTGVHALGDLTSEVHEALRAPAPAFCYAYHGDLDLLGHAHGPGSEPWIQQLGYIDRLAETLANGLPGDALLAITADHGMVTVTEQERVDFDREPHLKRGVRLLGGEPRMRHVYTEPGSAVAVERAWRERLGERAWVRGRAEAIDEGWFGPNVADRMRERIGDVLVAADHGLSVIRSAAEPVLSTLPGQHGSLTEDEQLIPLLLAG